MATTLKVLLVLLTESSQLFAPLAPVLASTYLSGGKIRRRKDSMCFIFFSNHNLMVSRFPYAMLVCMDANFRLKNNLVSNFSQDPGLSNGSAYIVAHSPYEEYVLSQADSKDVRISTSKFVQMLILNR